MFFGSSRKNLRRFAFCLRILRGLRVAGGLDGKEGLMLEGCEKGDYRAFIPFSDDEVWAMRRAPVLVHDFHFPAARVSWNVIGSSGRLPGGCSQRNNGLLAV
jgi:hypothetical protein